jgi:hypothetical protein
MKDNIPPPLMTSEPGSYARYTVEERKPSIIQNTLDDNGYPPDIVAALQAFRNEIARQPLQPLTGLEPDVAFWHRAGAAYHGRTWRDLPWFFAETYFYRRLLEIVRYFQPGDWHDHDPFARQKRDQERQAVAWLAENWEQVEAVELEARLSLLLHSCLWGNRADLSNLAMKEQVRAGLDVGQEEHNILIDHPYFVSDAMPADVLALLDRIQGTLSGGVGATSAGQGQTAPAHKRLGQRLAGHIAAGRLTLKDDPFWTTCLMFREMPIVLAAELARADLVILKGDVNYRRLADDAHWPHTTPLEEIAAYFPASLVTLRTLKSEIMVGLEPGQAEAIAKQDPQWLINGKRGIIQYINKDTKAR